MDTEHDVPPKDRSPVRKDIVFCNGKAIEGEIHFLCTCNFYSKLKDTLFKIINSIEPTVVNILAISGTIYYVFNEWYVCWICS